MPSSGGSPSSSTCSSSSACRRCSGPGGGCHGDSGGGAFIQLSDGTWRLFGVAETLFDPDVVPDAMPGDEDGACGTGTTYSLLTDRLAWIEHVTGSDVTPCFTSAGDWHPGPQCGVLPLQPGHGHGTWAQSCQGPVGGELLCEPGPRPEPDPPEGSSTGDETQGESSSSTGGGWSSTGDASGATSEPPEEDPISTAGTHAVADGSCSVGDGGRAWLLLVLLLFARRRRS